MKKIIITILVILLVNIINITHLYAAQTAHLTLSPTSGSYAVGNTFTINVYLDTGGNDVDGVDIHYLHFDPNLLQVKNNGVSIGSLFANTQTNTVDNNNGLIDFSQVSSGGNNYNGQGILAQIEFMAKASGTANITFDFTVSSTTDTNVASSGSDVLQSVNPSSIVIQSPSTPSPPTPDPPKSSDNKTNITNNDQYKNTGSKSGQSSLVQSTVEKVFKIADKLASTGSNIALVLFAIAGALLIVVLYIRSKERNK